MAQIARFDVGKVTNFHRRNCKSARRDKKYDQAETMKTAPLQTIKVLFCFCLLSWVRSLDGQSMDRQSKDLVAPSDSIEALGADPQQQAKINAIMKRIHAGDWSAVDDVPAQLDRSVGAELLSILLMSQDDEDEPHRQAAGRALAKLGVERGFADRIVRATRDIARPGPAYYSGIQDRYKAFRALQYMRSNGAVTALAGLLDDDTIPAQVDADVVESPTCELAAIVRCRNFEEQE